MSHRGRRRDNIDTSSYVVLFFFISRLLPVWIDRSQGRRIDRSSKSERTSHGFFPSSPLPHLHVQGLWNRAFEGRALVQVCNRDLRPRHDSTFLPLCSFVFRIIFRYFFSFFFFLLCCSGSRYFLYSCKKRKKLISWNLEINFNVIII